MQFNRGEREMINMLWAYLENGLLSKEEFIYELVVCLEAKIQLAKQLEK